MQLTWQSGGDVDAEAWGAGADWLLDRLPQWLGADDDLAGFDPALDDRVARLWRQHGRFRLAAIGVIWQELLLVIIGQRVASGSAIQSWIKMCHRWSEPAPGPCELMLPPDPAVIAAVPYTAMHEIGIERRRADAINIAARRANRLEEAASMTAADAVTRLTALPGLGMWTATATLAVSLGDPDTVIVGDYGMPTLANYFFTGDARRLPPEPDGDRIMLEHLAPWTGHRHRVMRLLMASGVSVPRRAPRARNPDIRRM